MNKTILGIIIGVVFSTILIYSVNENYSLIQLFIGFIIFIFPSIFLSSFKSRTLSTILTVVIMLFAYFTFKFNFNETWLGVLMALILGLPIYFLKIRKLNN
jgi:hypothetical protein